ncbi:MAG: ATP-binding protein, partial [Lachnospiraceae bacterium]|nr:ATP-binding protein [Lachnospiraceae bacterium]
MLNCMKIQGFKCFREAEIRFSDFTLLAGRNSTGKSTVIQAV